MHSNKHTTEKFNYIAYFRNTELEDNLLEESKLELIQISKLSYLCYLMQKGQVGSQREERETQSLKKRLDLVSVFSTYILLTFLSLEIENIM